MSLPISKPDKLDNGKRRQEARKWGKVYPDYINQVSIQQPYIHFQAPGLKI